MKSSIFQRNSNLKIKFDLIQSLLNSIAAIRQEIEVYGEKESRHTSSFRKQT